MLNKDISENRTITVIDTTGQPQNPTYLRRAKGLVKNGRAEWIDENTIRLFESNKEQMERKIIDKVFPPLGGAEASPFCACLTSLIYSQNKRFNLAAKKAEHRIGMTYFHLVTASGLAFSYIYQDDYFSEFDKTVYYKEFNDERIQYALNFGKCNYRIITCDTTGLKDEVIHSIDCGIPVLAESLADNTWCLITGYENAGKTVFGYTTNCYNCNPCVKCIKPKVDGYIENGMFFKSNWDKSVKRIIIIDDFNAQPYGYKEYMNHWISIMQHEPKNGFKFGMDAYDAVIQLLEDDSVFENAGDKELTELYRFLFTNSFIPENRCYAGYAFSKSPDRRALLDHMGLNKGKYPEMESQIVDIKSKSFQMHKYGWYYWEALSDKKLSTVDPERYLQKLKMQEHRKKAVDVLRQLKEMDAFILNGFKEIRASS